MRRQVCRGRTNEERGKKSKDGSAERNFIGLTTSGCCSQQLYICVGSSVLCCIKGDRRTWGPSHSRLIQQVTELQFEYVI